MMLCLINFANESTYHISVDKLTGLCGAALPSRYGMPNRYPVHFRGAPICEKCEEINIDEAMRSEDEQ